MVSVSVNSCLVLSQSTGLCNSNIVVGVILYSKMAKSVGGREKLPFWALISLVEDSKCVVYSICNQKILRSGTNTLNNYWIGYRYLLEYIRLSGCR